MSSPVAAQRAARLEFPVAPGLALCAPLGLMVPGIASKWCACQNFDWLRECPCRAWAQ